ncbi:hypothetical protein K0M31_017436 [Melipona bicolor]|uniref:Dipeptidase n=1 Tax=Melipona bicolor TaxID=60889 RepID=A0AA40KSF4_9HYME|nr:hypothetical protein K0M31_017436 [Melipona bicolor]
MTSKFSSPVKLCLATGLHRRSKEGEGNDCVNRKSKVPEFWSAYVPCSSQHLDSVQLALEQIDLIRRLVNKHPESMVLVTTAEGEAFRLQLYAFVTPAIQPVQIQCQNTTSVRLGYLHTQSGRVSVLEKVADPQDPPAGGRSEGASTREEYEMEARGRRTSPHPLFVRRYTPLGFLACGQHVRRLDASQVAGEDAPLRRPEPESLPLSAERPTSALPATSNLLRDQAKRRDTSK